MRTTLTRRRVEITLSSHVVEVRPGVYMATVQDSEARLRWQSVPVTSYSLAEYLGWFHMSLLASRLQQFGDNPD